MTLAETIASLDSFVPTGEEQVDVARLDEIVGGLAGAEQIKAAIPAILRVFERFPGTLLGSPGPLVHCVERAGMETFLPMVLASFKSHPNRMTLWMIDRCLWTGVPTQLHLSILSTLREIRRTQGAADLHDDIDERLEEYGKPRG
jgi:hypothetical protein